MDQQSLNLLEQFLSHDNHTRKNAEQSLNQLKDSNFSQGLQFFLQGIQSSKSELQELSAVLLKKYYIDDHSSLQKLSKEQQDLILQVSVSQIQVGQKLITLKRFADVIVQIHTFKDTFPELMGLIQQVSTAQDENNKMKLLSLYLIEIVCEFSFNDELILQYTPQITSIFQQYLEATDVNLKTEALKVTAIFLQNINDERLLKQFANVLPVLISTCVLALKSDEQAGRVAIEALADLADVHPKFIKPILNDMLQLMNEVMGTTQFSEETRGAALNAITILATKNSGLLRQSEFFRTQILSTYMKLLKEVDSEVSLEQWNKDLKEEVISKNDVSSLAYDSLSKISQELGPKFTMPNFIMLIQQQLKDDTTWQSQYGSLMAISVIIEGASESYKGELDNIMAFVIPLTQQIQNNPRMAWAALTCFALFCSEFHPNIQNKYHEPILNLFIQQMKNDAFIKLQYRAVSSLINFCREIVDVESSVLTSYSAPILECIIYLLQKGITQSCYPLVEESLTALSLFAIVLDDKFSQYYNQIMPFLKNLFGQLPAETPEQINIRVLTIECIGYLVSSIKSEQQQFYEDLNQIMSTLIQYQQSITSEDDPHHAAIISVFSHFSNCLKEQFAQYLPLVYDKVAKALQIKVDFFVDSNDLVDELNDKKYATQTVDLKLFGGKKTLALNTYAIEQKIAGSAAMLSLVRSNGKQFQQYTEQTKNIVKEYISYKHSKEIRKNCIESVYYLLLTCNTDQEMAYILNDCLPPLLQELQKVFKVQNEQEIFYLLEQINKQIRLFKTQLLNSNLIVELTNLLSEGIKLQQNLKNKLLKEIQDNVQDMDQKEREDFEEEYEEINDIMQITMEITVQLMKVFKEQTEGLIFQNIVPTYYDSFKKKNATQNEILYAVCLFDEVLEHCSPQIFNNAAIEIFNIFLNLYNDSNNNKDIKHSVIYGFGVFAMRLDNQQFLPFYQQILQSLLQNIGQQDAHSKDNLDFTEQSISVLGKLALFQHNSQNQQNSLQILQQFLQYLPLKGDSDESQSCHKIFFKQVLNKNSILASAQNETLAAIQNIKNVHLANPELEILDDEGAQLLQQLLQ